MNRKEFINKNIRYNENLNPVAWENESLNPVIQARLLTIADMFIDSINIDDIEVQDIVLTGSNANFNWTKFSDFDVHIIIDFADFDREDVAAELFNAKKMLWNQTHDITIKGHDIELYVEDSATPAVSQGVYSLLNSEWIKKPKYQKPDINDFAVYVKAKALMQMIDSLVESGSKDQAEFQLLIDKIWKMRKSGLAKNGEYSTENLAFKILRNEGYLTKLRKANLELVDTELTIEQTVQ
jgi:predicted nucleotidyltransferase